MQWNSSASYSSVCISINFLSQKASRSAYISFDLQFQMQRFMATLFFKEKF